MTSEHETLSDYGLVKQGCDGLFMTTAVLEVPWRPHCGLAITIKNANRKWWHKSLHMVPSLPVHDRPNKRGDANPESRRTKKLQAARERRVQNLPLSYKAL